MARAAAEGRHVRVDHLLQGAGDGHGRTLLGRDEGADETSRWRNFRTAAGDRWFPGAPSPGKAATAFQPTPRCRGGRGRRGAARRPASAAAAARGGPAGRRRWAPRRPPAKHSPRAQIRGEEGLVDGITLDQGDREQTARSTRARAAGPVGTAERAHQPGRARHPRRLQGARRGRGPHGSQEVAVQGRAGHAQFVGDVLDAHPVGAYTARCSGWRRPPESQARSSPSPSAASWPHRRAGTDACSAPVCVPPLRPML